MTAPRAFLDVNTANVEANLDDTFFNDIVYDILQDTSIQESLINNPIIIEKLTPIAVNMKVDGDFSQFENDIKKRKSFENDFKDALANSLDTDVSRILIRNLSGGSVVVDFELTSDSNSLTDDTIQSPKDLLNNLKEQMMNSESPLRTNKLTENVLKIDGKQKSLSKSKMLRIMENNPVAM